MIPTILWMLVALTTTLVSCRDDKRPSVTFKDSAKLQTVIKENEAQFKAIERGLEDDILAQIENFQDWLANGNPDLGIPVLDPAVVEHFEYGTSSEDITFNVVVDGFQVTGLSSFTVAELDLSLLQLKFGGTVNIQELHITADHYYLDGVIAGILPLFGEGKIDLTVHNLNLTGHTALKSTDGIIGLHNLTVGASFESVSGQIENLLGSDLDDAVNDIINILGADIFNTVAEMVSADIAAGLQASVNAQLIEMGMTLQDLIDLISGNTKHQQQFKVPVTSSHKLTRTRKGKEGQVGQPRKGNADVYLDVILDSVQGFLAGNGYSNYTLPDISQSFSQEWLGVTWTGQADMSNGWLTGLDTIHRAGDAFVIVEGDNSTITLSGSIEFFNLSAAYDAHIKFMGIDLADARADVAVSSVQVFLKATLLVDSQSAEKNFAIVIDELHIANPGTIEVHFSGLGALDFLLDALASIVANSFGSVIFDAIEGPIKEAIMGALGETIDPNKYLDDVLESVGDMMAEQGWDTFPLPDQIEGFSVDFLGVTWHAEATMTEGFISGLETIHRTQDVVISVDQATDAIVVDAGIEFFDFTAGYTLYIGVMGLGIDAGASITISQVKVHLVSDILITNDTSALDAKDLIRGTEIIVEQLDLENEFFITVNFDGLGLFNFLLDAMGIVVVNLFSGFIFDLIEGPVATALEEALAELVPSRVISQVYPHAVLAPRN